MKSLFLHIIFFIFTLHIPSSVYGNTNTREYCENLFRSAKEEYSNNNYTKCIELLTETKTLAEANNWNDIKRKSLNNLGVLYQAISDYEKAMEYYLEAYQIALKEPNQKREEAIILNNIAGLYATDKEYDKATEYFQKAMKISQEVKDTIGMMHIYNNLGTIANETGNMDLAIQYANSSLKLSQNIPTDRMIQAQQIKAAALYQKKEYNVAEKLAMGTFEKVQNNKIEYQYTISLILLITKIFQEQGKGQLALSFAQKALNYNPSLAESIDIYEQMASLYQKNRFSDLALAYKDSVIVLKDSLHKINAWTNIENSRVRFELLNSEKELSENKAKQKMERTLFSSIFGFMAILTIVLIWVFRIQSIRNKQRKQITELELEKEKNLKMMLEQQFKEKETLAYLEQKQLNNEKVLLKQQLKEQEMMRLLEQERLNNEIEIKNKQLIAKALSQSNRNELINDTVSLLSEMTKETENPRMELTIRKLKAQLKDSSDWDNFLVHFEKINPSLFSYLKEDYPSLTANDIHLLSYLYLNLSTEKIAYLLNISIEACRKKKQRLANKMGLKTNELHVYLVNKIKYSTPKQH